MSETHQNPPKIIAEKDEDFKQIFADGVYTWLGTESGTLSFFVDSVDPAVDEKGALQIKTVKRRFKVEIRMSPVVYNNLIAWMTERRDLLEKTQLKSK